MLRRIAEKTVINSMKKIQLNQRVYYSYVQAGPEVMHADWKYFINRR